MTALDYRHMTIHLVPPGATVTECCSLPLGLIEDGHGTSTAVEFVNCSWA